MKLSLIFSLIFFSFSVQAQNTYTVIYEYNKIMTPEMEPAFRNLGQEYIDAYPLVSDFFELKTDGNNAYYSYERRDMKDIDTTKVKIKTTFPAPLYKTKGSAIGYRIEEEGLSERDLFELDWDFDLKGDTTILGYTCKKAHAFKEGVLISIWYTTEVENTLGPSKFNCSRGFILYLKSNSYKMQAICMNETDEVLSVLGVPKKKKRKKRK